MRAASRSARNTAARSSPVAWPATATAITTALNGQSAENNESPERTPKAVRIGCRRTYEGGGAAGVGVEERSSVMVMSRGYVTSRDRSRTKPIQI
jgi:hypothetical protein